MGRLFRLRNPLSSLELWLAFVPVVWVLLSAPSARTRETYRCERVIDGDTIVLRLPGGDRHCRLIGVDTPETVHPSKAVEYYGKEASSFLKSLVEGKDVQVAYNGSMPTYDRFHRRLVYIYLEGNPPLFVNREIVARGYGRVFRSQAFRYRNEFLDAEDNARRKKLGQWAKADR